MFHVFLDGETAFLLGGASRRMFHVFLDGETTSAGAGTL